MSVTDYNCPRCLLSGEAHAVARYDDGLDCCTCGEHWDTLEDFCTALNGLAVDLHWEHGRQARQAGMVASADDALCLGIEYARLRQTAGAILPRYFALIGMGAKQLVRFQA